jgi:hypothetical protein
MRFIQNIGSRGMGWRDISTADGRGQIAVRLSFVSVSSPHSIQRADPMIRVDCLLVAE